MGTYNKISKNIHQITIDNPQNPNKAINWYNIINPRKNEIEYLRKKFNFSLSHLQASSSLSTSQRPSIEIMDNYIFMILHFPFLNDETVVSAEIEFFMGEDYLITSHNNMKALNDFFNLYKKDGDSLLAFKYDSPAVLLYEILETLMFNCFSIFDKNAIQINELEEQIFSQESKRAVSSILLMRRNIINTRRILQNHKSIIAKLAEIEIKTTDEEEIKKMFSKLQETSEKVWANLESQKEMIEVLNNTNESLLNYKISDIMKTLTIFSVIVFPLTLLAAIFGMNTIKGMPFIDSENGFWIIIVLMGIGCLGMLLFFEKKGWLK
jgi:magnesium transporter